MVSTAVLGVTLPKCHGADCAVCLCGKQGLDSPACLSSLSNSNLCPELFTCRASH